MHLAGITLFPVKSLRGQACETARVEPWGLAGDRRFMVVDARGRFLSQRECPAMATVAAALTLEGVMLSGPAHPGLRVATPGPGAEAIVVTVWNDAVPARCAGPAARAWLEGALGRPCRLVHMAEPHQARPADPTFAQAQDRVSFADGFPLLVTSTASLDDLNGRLAVPVGMDRFRANLVVTGALPWAEDGWRHLRVGSVLFEAVKPCGRCIVVTTDQATGARDAGVEPIRSLQKFRRDRDGQVIFGQNLVPRSGGTVSIGDSVEVLTNGPRFG